MAPNVSPGGGRPRQAARAVVDRVTGRAQAAAEQRVVALERRVATLLAQRDRSREAERELTAALAAAESRHRATVARAEKQVASADKRVTSLEASAERRIATLEARAETLRAQRDRGRQATRTLLAAAQLLEVDGDPVEAGHLVRRAVQQVAADASLVAHLVRGEDLDVAAVRTVRALLATPQSVARARALVTALQSDARTAEAGAVAAGHYLATWGSRQAAHEQFSRAPVALVVRTGAAEAVRTALHVEPAAGDRLAEQVVEHPDLTAEDAWVLTGVLVGHHRLPLARRALDRAREGSHDEVRLGEFDRLQSWLDSRPAELDAIAPRRERPVLGVVAYDHPHLARESINLGDYTQTVAFLGHLVRRRGLVLRAEDPELQGALDTLRADVDPARVVESPPAEVDVVPVSRDASRWAALPEPTWMVAFGWYMRQVFDVRNDLPFHAAIRPIFLSFHIDRPKILTPPAVAYLRAHGPVGCRDWTTVDLLLSHGVDAFFSGCLTTTVDITAGRRAPGEGPSVDGDPVPVDLRGQAAGTGETQVLPELRGRSLARNLLAAHDRHRQFRDDWASLRTSRLHVYLPATAIGVPVSFEPLNPADARYEGLSGLRPGSPELAELQGRVTGLVDLVLDLVVSGADEEQVRAAWHRRCEPLVEQARARRERRRATRPDVVSLAGAAEPVAAAAVHLGEGGDVHVAMALDQNLIEQAPVVLQGIAEGTRRDVRVHLSTRGVTTEVVEAWAAAFPSLRFSHYRFDDVEYGSIARMLSHTTVSTMDRLLLPDLLSDLDRVVYIDIDVVVRGDVGELWDLDLSGAALAARLTISEWAESGLAFVYRAARRLPADVAQELRAFIHARMEGDFTSFNAGVMVLDLARMRADRFTADFAGMAGRYGFNDQDVLCCYAGSHVAALDPRWNAFPTREVLPDDVRLVHYAGEAKPWQSLRLPAQELWLRTRDRWEQRRSAART